MTFVTVISLLPALLGFSAAAPGEPAVRTVITRNEIIMRIPVRPGPRLRKIVWVERKGPECIPMQAIRGATLSGRSHVDFLLRKQLRVRAELSDDCPALDFYNGFYLTPEDKKVCAGRDTIRSRIGGSCQIERFRRLVPKRKLRRP